jgi:hypothetical protein
MAKEKIIIRDPLETYRETEAFVGKTRMRYSGSITAAILAGVLGISSIFYLNHITKSIESFMDVSPAVTNSIGTEQNGNLSQTGLQNFLDEMHIGYRAKKGDLLYLETRYGTSIEISIISNKTRSVVGTTERQVLEAYVRRHPGKK